MYSKKQKIYYFQLRKTPIHLVKRLTQNHKKKAEFKKTKSLETFSIDIPLTIEDGGWMLNLTS